LGGRERDLKDFAPTFLLFAKEDVPQCLHSSVSTTPTPLCQYNLTLLWVLVRLKRIRVPERL